MSRRRVAGALAVVLLATPMLLASCAGLNAQPDDGWDASATIQVPGLGRVERTGRGEVPMILVAGIQVDGAAFRAFTQLNAHLYTFYSVTLPGIGGSPSLSDPEGDDFTETPWWSQVVRGLSRLIGDQNLDRPWIVGELEGGYAVLRLMLEHPEEVAGGVVLNTYPGGNYVFYDPLDPVAFAPQETRIASLENVGSGPPFQGDPAARRRGARVWSATYAKDQEVARSVTAGLARTNPDVRLRYRKELFTQDLTETLRDLARPLLVLMSIHDDASPFAGAGIEMATAEWLAIAFNHPQSMIQVHSFEDARQLLSIDATDDVSRAIRLFVAGEPVRIARGRDPGRVANVASPRREVMTTLAATEVRVAYGSPAKRGREIWGGLVPYGRLWRAGANASTTVEFGRDVLINGRRLPAGRYSYYVRPEVEGPWELAFHRRAPDVGTAVFSYDESQEALRLTATPRPLGEAVENLHYTVEPTGVVGGRVSLRWDTLEIGFDLEAPEGLGSTVALGPLTSVERLTWSVLAEDPADGSTAALPDAREVSYAWDGDRLWLRITLDEALEGDRFGINVAVDQDRDFATGGQWWGGNAGFTFDRVFTAWVLGTEAGHKGIVGMSDENAFGGLFATNLARDNFRLALDAPRGRLYVGLEPADVDDDGRFRLLVAVGSNVAWNDDVPNQSGTPVDLSREWPRQ